MLFLRYVGTCNVFPGRVRQQVFAHISVYLAYVTRRGWSRRVPSKGTFALDHVSIVTLLFSFFWSIFLRPFRFLIIWNQINPRKRSIPIRIDFHIYFNCRVRLRIIILSNTMRDFIFYVNLRHIWYIVHQSILFDAYSMKIAKELRLEGLRNSCLNQNFENNLYYSRILYEFIDLMKGRLISFCNEIFRR